MQSVLRLGNEIRRSSDSVNSQGTGCARSSLNEGSHLCASAPHCGAFSSGFDHPPGHAIKGRGTRISTVWSIQHKQMSYWTRYEVSWKGICGETYLSSGLFSRRVDEAVLRYTTCIHIRGRTPRCPGPPSRASHYLS